MDVIWHPFQAKNVKPNFEKFIDIVLEELLFISIQILMQKQ
jgi:hypothetical protein